MAATDVERIAAFEHRFARSQATDIVDLPWGFVLLQSDYPKSHAHNKVVVTAEVTAHEIMTVADEVLGGVDLRHRLVSVGDHHLGEALKPELVAAGYDYEARVLMIHSGSALDPATHPVSAVPLDVMQPAIRRDWQAERPDFSTEALDQLTKRTVLYPLGADITHLAAFEGDEIATRAALYIDPAAGVAQFESLVTHPRFRGKGYARAVVREGLRRATDSGCDLSFLDADHDDWPRQWYSRLGYVDAQRTHHFSS